MAKALNKQKNMWGALLVEQMRMQLLTLASGPTAIFKDKVLEGGDVRPYDWACVARYTIVVG